MRKVMVLLPLIFILAVGCSPKLSTKGKATMLLATYNSQASRTMVEADRCLAAGDACTEDQRIVIRKKKELIVKMDKGVKTYGSIVAAGGTPSVDDEQALYDIIDQLVLLSP
jgi:hypothetical protein